MVVVSNGWIIPKVWLLRLLLKYTTYVESISSVELLSGRYEFASNDKWQIINNIVNMYLDTFILQK